MKRLLKVLSRVYHHVVERDYDEVIAIVGDEGIGKTNVGLHIIDNWVTRRYGEVREGDAKKFIALDSPDFARVLYGLKQYDGGLHDEAADLSARGSMSKTNRLYAQAYQIIRGDNLLTILILPSLFDLDPFFRKRRIKHMILVYGRGKLAFWSKSRLRRMVEINERLPYKNYFVVKPTFYDTFPKYKGKLLKEYKEMKAKKMKSVRQWLYQEMKNMSDPDTEKHLLEETVMGYLEKGMNVKQVADLTGYHPRSIYRIKRRRKSDR